jgi:hypothetical protein
MLKVLLFLSFLIAFALFAWAAFKSSKKLQSDLLMGKSFWSGELMLLVSLGGFFALIYLLSGLWSLKLVLLMLVAAHLGSLAAWVLSAILGAQSEKIGLRALWAGKEIDIKYALPMRTLGLLTGLIFLAYPVVTGILFFRHQWGSQELQILIVKYSLLLLCLCGYVVLMIVVSISLASENLDEDTRQRLFINLLSGMIPGAVYVSLAFWAFGLGGKQHSFDFLGISRTISLQTWLLLLVFFSATILVPYLVGTQRARWRNLSLLERIRDIVAELAEILGSPASQFYISKLGGLRDKVLSTQEKFRNDDALLALAKEIGDHPDQVPAEAEPIVNALEKTRDMDARFRFLDALDKLEKELEEIAADLQKRPEATIEVAAEHWSKKYETRKADLIKEIETARTRKPLVTVGVGALATAILSGILSEVAKSAWHLVTHAPK